jgi:SNF2 family DNA or RNA helicase
MPDTLPRSKSDKVHHGHFVLNCVDGLLYLPEQDKYKPALVVCPLAVVDNWEREFKLWCPEMEVVVYKGSQVSQSVIRKFHGPS